MQSGGRRRKDVLVLLKGWVSFCVSAKQRRVDGWNALWKWGCGDDVRCIAFPVESPTNRSLVVAVYHMHVAGPSTYG